MTESQEDLQKQIDDLDSEMKALKESLKAIFENKMAYREVIESLKKEAHETDKI